MEKRPFARFGAVGLDGEIGGEAILDARGDAVLGAALRSCELAETADVEPVVQREEKDEKVERDCKTPVDEEGGRHGEDRADEVGEDL